MTNTAGGLRNSTPLPTKQFFLESHVLRFHITSTNYFDASLNIRVSYELEVNFNRQKGPGRQSSGRAKMVRDSNPCPVLYVFRARSLLVHIYSPLDSRLRE